MKTLYKYLSILLVCAMALTMSVCAAAPSAVFGDEPETVSTFDLLYEVNSGQILYGKGVYEKAYPASTTKVMTALLALENCELDEIITVTGEAWRGIDRNSSIAGLSTGECMPLSLIHI